MTGINWFQKYGSASLRLLTCLLLCISLPGYAGDEDDEQSIVVWSEPIGDDFEIFGSFRSQSGWGDGVRLVSAKETDILACAMPLDGGSDASSALVVWTKMISFEESYLNYLVWTDGVKPDDSSTFETGFAVNTGVSMVKDGGGTIWLGWAGFDGTDDDIYVARWSEQGWSEPVLVNAPDDLPDIRVSMGLSAEGRPWLSWMGLGDGGYQRFFSRYNGSEWIEEVVLPENKAKDFEKLLAQRLEDLPALPEHVGEPTKACITHLDGHIVQTLRYPEPAPLSEPGSDGSDSPAATTAPAEVPDSGDEG